MAASAFLLVAYLADACTTLAIPKAAASVHPAFLALILVLLWRIRLKETTAEKRYDGVDCVLIAMAFVVVVVIPLQQTRRAHAYRSVENTALAFTNSLGHDDYDTTL